MKYLKYFQKQTDYQSFITGDTFVTPNVSFAEEENLVFYNPYEEPINPSVPNNVITYTASEKLPESDGMSAGLMTDAFNTTMVSHEFTNGVGTITFEEDVTEIRENAFFGCDTLTSINIPDSVTYIGDYAFQSCEGLTSFIIGSRVTDIGYSAFKGCSSLTSITIPDSVTYIGDYAFSSCTGLTSMVIPFSITEIGKNVFYNCSSLTSKEISDVSSIGAGAFSSCSNLSSITCYSEIAPMIDRRTFTNVKEGGILRIPEESDYSSWMRTDYDYLGKYNWTIEYI